MSEATPATITIPCDQCRRRKVRCDYTQPCERCNHHGFVCTFDSVRRKRGPRASRGPVIDELRARSCTAANAGPGPDMPYGPQPCAVSGSPNVHRPSSAVSAHSYQTEFPSEATSGNTLTGSADVESGYLTFSGFAQEILAPWQDPTANEDWSPVAATSSSLVDQQISPLADSVTLSTSPDTVHPRNFVTTPVVERGVALFITHLYPTYPLLDQQVLQSLLIETRDLNRSESTLLWSICALALVSIDLWPTLDTDKRATACKKYIQWCHDARLAADYIEDATFYDVLASLFISVACFELKSRKASWFYLREAITLSHAADLLDADCTSDSAEKLRHQRTFALLYITERGACTLNNFPVSIILPPGLPTEALPDEDPSIIFGLSSLYHLFSLLDSNFVRLWNDTGLSSASVQGQNDLATLQNHLRETLDMRHVSDIQRANVLITQQWLRLIFWQSALKLSMVTSTAPDSAFTYEYPIEIATSLCEVVKSLPPVAIQAHGLGIFEKQFEVAYSLLDALTICGYSKKARHHETLRYLLLSLSASDSSRQVYVRTLERKMGQSAERSGAEHKYLRLAGFELLQDGIGSRLSSRR
ncbi:hypothetical protein LTR95_005199 [Oleoguttula sp. CCFEE 5521]